MSVKGRVRAQRTLDAHSAALKVRKATGVGVGLGGEPQPRTGTLSGFDVGFAFEGVGERSAQASGIVTREGRNRQIAVSVASRARPDAQQMQLDFSQEHQEAFDFCAVRTAEPDRLELLPVVPFGLHCFDRRYQGRVKRRRIRLLYTLQAFRSSQQLPCRPAHYLCNRLSRDLHYIGGLAAAW